MEEETTTVSSGEMSTDTDPQGEMPTTPATSEMQDAPTTQQPSPDAAQKDLQKELADLRAALKKANTDAKENRLAKEELKRLKEEAEIAKLSETEKLQKQYDDLKAQHDEYTQAQTERAIRQEVGLEAAKLGVDPNYLDKVARFLDWEEIDVDENGHPTNIRELVEQLIKEMPSLKPMKGAPTSGGATNPPRSTTTARKEISWDMIAQLTPAEYAARAPEIQEWMAKHSRR